MREADAEERRLAAQAEERRIVAEAEKRRLAAEAEERKIAAEERRITSEERKAELEVEKLRLELEAKRFFQSQNVVRTPPLPSFVEGKDNLDEYLPRFMRYADVAEWNRSV